MHPFIACFLATLPFTATNGTVGPLDPFEELADPWHLAVFDLAPTRQISSADPLDANLDYNHFAGTGPDGAPALADLRGPGVVTRLWLTGSRKILDKARLRIWIDNGDIPTVDLPILALFAGETSPFLSPLVGSAARSSGGYYSYVPVPYAHRCVIDASGLGEDKFYYNVTYRDLTGFPPPRPLVLPLDATREAALRRCVEQWTALGQEPKEEHPQTRELRNIGSLAPASSAVLAEVTGPGSIASLRIRLFPMDDSVFERVHIRLFWDNEPAPAVDVPLGLFFCTASETARAQGLLLGYNGATFYCFLPMPFSQSARLVLGNHGGQPVERADVRLRIAPAREQSNALGQFHARYNAESRMVSPDNYRWLTRAARGRFIGVSTVMRGDPGDLGYLEGDEMIWVDGELEPSIAGTGTEDYFNAGWYYEQGPFSCPLHGCPLKNQEDGRTGSYRIHMLDAVPFQRSIVATVEHGSNNAYRGFYESVAFWYEAPGSATDAELSLPAPASATQPRPGANLLYNPGAEGSFAGWTTGGMPSDQPTIDPWTHVPDPPNRSGNHRFGLSVGWKTADCYQYQTVGVTPGQSYEAGFWVTHENGTDETVELAWIDGAWGGTEETLIRTREEREPEWTEYRSQPFVPSATQVTVVVRFRHPVPSDIASIHLDDLELVELLR